MATRHIKTEHGRQAVALVVGDIGQLSDNRFSAKRILGAGGRWFAQLAKAMVLDAAFYIGAEEDGNARHQQEYFTQFQAARHAAIDGGLAAELALPGGDERYFPHV